jgi:hypothetical protein
MKQRRNHIATTFNEYGDPVIQQIVSDDQCYQMFLTAEGLGLAHTTTGKEPCVFHRFKKRLHSSLPGAEAAKKGDFVFSAVVPVQKLRRFFDELASVEA